MEVSFYDPHLPDGADLAHNFRRVPSLEALLAEADVVSLHCPLNADNANLIGASALTAMKSDALLINTARGGLIDIEALETALREGRIGGAGLDVFPGEPIDPSHPLVQALAGHEPWVEGRLLMTPHIAWFSAAGRADLRRKSAETARDYLTERKLRNCVNHHHLTQG
jgi:D-3-phosphoglycerate dehydrogenase/C-terminal binding protein